jgi:dTMP kinase
MGLFVTFEGGEGCGKTSLAESLRARLEALGHEVVRTREPGGSPLAERMRVLLLSGAFASSGAEAEAVCFALARSDHVSKVIGPALDRGAVVLCDRFFDSTRAYQGAAGKAVPGLLDALEAEAVGDRRPDLTFVLDCPVDVAHERARTRRGSAGADRFEGEDRAFHEAVRAGFLAVARRDANRCRILDASRPPGEVADIAWERLAALLPEPPQAAAPR